MATPRTSRSFPSPGLLRTLVETGEVVEAPEGVEANVDENWSPDWKAYGTIDDVFYAAPMLANVKGYVWYSPASFEEWGVEVPTTWDELLELTATIQETTGAPPWCAGFSSEAASGWPGTDWIEDIVLRQSGPEVYDQWVANEVKFTDPEIADAFDALDEILRNPEYVNAGFGDVASINSTRVRKRRRAGRHRDLRAHAPGVVPRGELPRHRDRRGRGADRGSRRRRLRVRRSRASPRARLRSRSAASSSPPSPTTLPP